MTVKCTFFNPTTLKKRVKEYVITRDYVNHGWEINGGFYRDDPVKRVKKYAPCLACKGEYCTIKIKA